ncbi:GNAT family N-acetyltransferase [Amycolatopsis benzoatilytica]|uniref:GNAT family N-acetyltransferase n=1 Tax=Amycolatopsis benzoatilytica TaxID=346045 RepID=UPI00037132BE|nr:GNAT family N-acetyltransferase [Amycolatopsis benzoatilytica]
MSPAQATPTIRSADPADYPAVAALRWHWVAEQDGSPELDRAEFVQEFTEWAHAHQDSHRCFVAARGDQLLGMAFLAITPRVPTPRSFSRTSGDVQCVYVVPEERDSGLGGQLIEATLAFAAELGLERVTVHSSERAVPGYQRWGFDASPLLLQRDLRR